MRQLAQPVAVITAPIHSTDADLSTHDHGATLSSFTSIALSPIPLVAFSLRLPSRMAAHLQRSPAGFAPSSSAATFAIHLLAGTSEGEGLSKLFARQGPSPTDAPTSPPAFFPRGLFDRLRSPEASLGRLDCRLVGRLPLTGLGDVGGATMAEGDPAAESELFVGAVEACELTRPDGEALPLLYHRQGYTKPHR